MFSDKQLKQKRPYMSCSGTVDDLKCICDDKET